MCLVLDLGQFLLVWEGHSISEAVDHPETFMKSNVSPQVFLFYNETNGPKLQNTPHFWHLQETLSLNFLEMNFPNIGFVIIQLNIYWKRCSC